MPETVALDIEHDAPIDTWFGIGGRADRLARPSSIEELGQCIALDANLKVFGEGANLLVADGGVRALVVSLAKMNAVSIGADGFVRAQAGADLMRLINGTVRAGLAGLHTLTGVPASIGGAIAMNAGGAFGNTFDHLREITTMDRAGVVRTEPASAFEATYRDGGLGGRIVVEAVFELEPEEPMVLRERVKDIMAQKKASQPMAADSAGCVFKNPTLAEDIEGVGKTGQRVSAGMLIDRAGCKGLAAGGARVSERHANFVVVDKATASAADVIELIEAVRQRVHGAFGVKLATEVVVWSER